MYRRFGKRAFDLVVVLGVLPVLAPVLAAIAALVRLRLGTPVFFRQQRPGLDGAPFMMTKFRTMTDERDAAGDLLPDEDRLTRMGRLLRSTSLDELPELMNVLRGSMSLVGPRPLLMEYLPLYSPEQARRHEARPGITGWAQVNGRNATTWKRRFACDCWYVDHVSLWVDLHILVLTVTTTLQREGISQEGHVTMTKFTGSTGEETKGDR